mgnify:CR=1 FL=1
MKSKLFASILALFLGVTAFAQNTITGVVSDNIGPAAGVSVVEQGTSNGTITDLDGKFTLSVRNGASIVVSSIGYKDQVIVVGSQRQFTILIEEDNELLEEVVVVGYGVQKKKLVTGATVQVKGDELAKINSTSALGAMQSSTPGVQIINSSGQPGEGYNVNIRGMGTTGSYQPLYVIDGVPGGDINALNPSDIESIDVLKDAASSAIYGARGANGVILVTTKQGKSGKYSVSYDGFYGWQNSPKLPDLLDAKQYMEVQNMVKLNNGEAMIDWANVLSTDLYNSIMNGSNKGTDWLKAIHNDNAPITNHAINITGGTERSKFAFGVSYTGQEGVFGKPVASKYDRTTVRLNSDHVLWQKDGLDIISFGENFSFTYSKKSGIGIGNHYWNDIFNMLVANPIAPLYRQDGEFAAFDEYNATGLWTLDNTVANPIYMMATSSRGNNWSHNYGLNMSVNLRVQPIKNLVWRSQFNFKQSSNTYRQYDMIFKAGNGNNMRNSDSVSQSASAGWNWSWENTVNYKFNIAQDHNFDVLAGTSIEHSGYGESVGAARATGAWPNDPTHAYVSNMNGDITSSNITGSPWGDSGLVSFFGRINYDYKERYLLSLIIRRDGSSNFKAGHRWGTFPSVSAGWVASNEDWWKSDVVNFFKLRGSWGRNGNCAVDNFQYLATVAIGPDNGGYAFGHGAIQQWQVGSYADKLANEDISWETSQQIDLGFDARFFNNRLTAAFDWYQKDTKDWLVNAPVMGHFGANAPYINGGEVRNSGVELALNWSDAINKDFSYSIGINGAYNKNRVTRIANEEGIIHGQGNVVQGIAEMYRAQVGYPIGYFWTYSTEGIFQNQAEIDAWKAAGKPTMAEIAVPGDVKFVDLNGDGILDDKDKTMTGDPNPDFTAGLNISIYFKGFDFALSGYGQFGQQIFRAWRRYSDSMWNNYTTEVYSYWHGEGTSNKLPRLVPGTNYNYMNNSDIFIEDASFFRIQTLTLGYDFKRLWKNAPFEKCRLYVQAQNPFCFTNYKGMDPEVGSSSGFDGWTKGIDLGFYPQARTILVGLNLNF